MSIGSLLVCTVLSLFSISEHLAATEVEAKGPVSASVAVNRSNITVGDPFQLTVEVSYSRDRVVEMPGPDIPLGAFELLAHHYSPLSEGDQDQVVARSIYTLTAFSTGEFEIPPITLSYRKIENGEEGSITTEPVKVTVESVLPADAEDIEDIKPPWEIPRNWLSLILACASAVVLMTLALIIWQRRRRSVQGGGPPDTPALPPHIEALKALNRLSNAGLLDRGEVVRYHVEVSEIMRRYFAGRFDIDALEMTSQQLLQNLPPEVVLSGPQKLLSQSDLVKFAKFMPSRSQSDGILKLAYEIVESTKPRFEPRAASGRIDNTGSPVLIAKEAEKN